jgi:hypothetical protein
MKNISGFRSASIEWVLGILGAFCNFGWWIKTKEELN